MDQNFEPTIPPGFTDASVHNFEPSINDDIIATRKAIVEGIARHNAAILDLQSQWNSIASISRLPPELLAEIFLNVRASYFPGTSFLLVSYSWMKVSHVCRHWRDVALQCPQLWNYLTVTHRSSPTFIAEVLARSKYAPLSVTADIAFAGNGTLNETVKKIMHDISRIRNIRLTVTTHQLADLTSGIDSAPDLLQSLTLKAHREPGRDHTQSVPLLQSYGLPRLQSLDLCGYPFVWGSTLFRPTITSIRIKDEPDTLLTPPTLLELLNSLDGMPALEKLDLEYVLPSTSLLNGALPATERTITLRHCRTVRIRDSLLSCASVLNHLVLHPDVTFDIQGDAHIGISPDLVIIAQTLNTKLTHTPSGAKTRPLRSLFIDCPYGSIILRGYNAEYGAQSLHNPPEVPTLTLQLLPQSHYVGNLLKPLCKELPLSDVCAVYIKTTDGHLYAEDWVTMFGHMQELRTLYVCGQGGDLIPAVLTTIRIGKKKKQKTILPALQLLKLEEIDFAYDEDGSNFYERLLDALKVRKRNSALNELAIAKCYNCTVESVTTLQPYVSVLNWDGLIDRSVSSIYEEEDELFF